ncbi:MAG: hypothetical protein K2H32_02535 [Muribaculaceae bacterium]|nr:hypothetical protein [Muribaculaceae bacterium]MDE5857219.1 hypothetical protein [Muribaculaceae bacterium]
MNEYNKNDIKHILDRYYEGKSSAADDAILRSYFAEDEVDEEFADDKLFFEALADTNDLIEVPSGLEQRLSDAVDSWNDSENRIADSRRRFRLVKFIPTFGIAASIAILFAIGSFVINNNGQNREPADTFTDPMEAYAETQRVLALFAGTMEKGNEGLEIANQGREKALAMAMEQLNKI